MTSIRKPDGWHSRRHETREAQDAAREAYKTRALRRSRQRWVETRLDGRIVKGWVKEVIEHG